MLLGNLIHESRYNNKVAAESDVQVCDMYNYAGLYKCTICRRCTKVLDERLHNYVRCRWNINSDCVIHHIMSNMVNDTVGEVVDGTLCALCLLQRCITETRSPHTNIECFHSGFPL